MVIPSLFFRGSRLCTTCKVRVALHEIPPPPPDSGDEGEEVQLLLRVSRRVVIRGLFLWGAEGGVFPEIKLYSVSASHKYVKNHPLPPLKESVTIFFTADCL